MSLQVLSNTGRRRLKVVRLTKAEEILLKNPPASLQAGCANEPWVGVTEEWCNAVQQRFEHQERRAAAIEMIEKTAKTLKGEGEMSILADGLPKSFEVRIVDTGGMAGQKCEHPRRVAEHVQYCCDCQTILVHDERVMIPRGELEGLQNAAYQMKLIALWLRENKRSEIESGAHAGRSDSDVIIGYMSR